jgi:hypothetical protein
MDATLSKQNQSATADVRPSSTASFAPFARQRTILLTTLRRDGTPVKTPVHMAGYARFSRTPPLSSNPDSPVMMRNP